MLLLACFAFFSLNLTKFPSHYFVYIFLGLFLFVLAFLRTNFALGILIFSMLLSPELAVGAVADRAVVLRFDDIFLLVIFVAWLAKLAVFKELGLLKRTPLNGPIFLYLLACVVSTAFMLLEGRGSINRSFFYFLKYSEYFMLYFLVTNNIENMKQAEIFVFFMVLTCVIVSLYALYSHFALGLRATAPFEGKEGEANTLAGYLVLLTGLLLGLICYLAHTQFKIWLLGALGLAVVTLLFTLSRSGWLSFIFMYMTFTAWTRRKKGILLFGFIAMISLAPLFAPHIVRERAVSTFQSGGKTYEVLNRRISVDESGTARIESWRLGFRKFLKRPILGYGIPSAAVVDNQYVRVLTELGIVGTLAFLFLLAAIYKALRFAVVHSSDVPLAQGIAIGCLAGYVGLLAHGFSAATFIVVRIMEPFWFLMAIVVLLPALAQQEAPHHGEVAGT